MSEVDKLSFEDPNLLRTVKIPNLQLAKTKGLEAKATHGLLAAKKRQKMYDGGLAAVIIDFENDFSESGRLAVKGFSDDLFRALTRFKEGVLTNECGLAHLLVSVDNHPPGFMIHGAGWYHNEQDQIPDFDELGPAFLVPTGDSKMPFEANYVSSGETGLLVPRLQKKYTVETYAPHLEKTGQGNIWVFPQHCIQGTDGMMMHPALSEFLTWASYALDLQVQFVYKGHIAPTDWFGMFEPCMPQSNHPQGGKEVAAYDVIRNAKVVDIVGEADDFCVRASMKQVLAEFKDDSDILNKIRFVKDCTSPIVADTADSTPNADFREAMKAAGIQLIQHDSPLALAA